MRRTITIVPAVLTVIIGVALAVALWLTRMDVGRRMLLALTADAIFMVVFGILMLFEAPRATDPARLPDTRAVLRQGLRSLSTALLAAAVIGLVFGLASGRG